MVKLVIKRLLLISFHARGNDMASKLWFEGVCPQESVSCSEFKMCLKEKKNLGSERKGILESALNKSH